MRTSSIRVCVCIWAVFGSSIALTGCEREPSSEAPDGVWEVALDADESLGTFLSVWGPASDDVWAVGGQTSSLSDPGDGTVMHFDGETWSEVELPPDTPLLNWVHGLHADEAWMVGNAGAALHLEGGQWTAISTGVQVQLWGVWMAAPDDVWAVGGDPFEQDGAGALLHYDGSAWSSVELPPLDRASRALFKVWGTGPDDVFAVGDGGVILHFDGTSWTQQPSGTGNDLISLWGTGPNEIVAVGGRQVGTIARYDGSTWQVRDVGRIPGLNGVWVDAQGDAVLVGNRGFAVGLPAQSFEIEPQSTDAGLLVLHAVYGFEDGRRFAVGGSLDRSPPYVGIIVTD